MHKAQNTLEAIFRSIDVNPHARFNVRRLPDPARHRLNDLQIGLAGLSNVEAALAIATTYSGKLRKILGRSVKTEKSAREGLVTRVAYLSPHVEAGVLTCPWATGLNRGPGRSITVTPGAGCAGNCLIGSGQMVYTQSRRSRILKTILQHVFPRVFVALLTTEIDRHARYVERLSRKTGIDYACGVRLNGTSDLRWETLAPDLFASFPRVVFYDYTKGTVAARRGALSIPNYHLTYSLADTTCQRSMMRAIEWQRQGVNVALVVKSREQVERILSMGSLLGRPVIDGDASDARPYDAPVGGWVLLYAKGKIDTEDPFVLDLDTLPGWARMAPRRAATTSRGLVSDLMGATC